VTAGFHPIGIDASADAVRVAKCNSPDLRVERQRMETFNLDQQFDLILIPFGSFEHLICLDDRLATLRRVLDHSHAETLLYIDIWPLDLSPDAWLQEQPARLLKTIRTDSTGIEVHFSATMEPARRRSTGRFLYREHLADGTAREVSTVYTVSPMTDDECKTNRPLCFGLLVLFPKAQRQDFQDLPFLRVSMLSQCRYHQVYE
jgi:trans-aconitate methyltransferase